MVRHFMTLVAVGAISGLGVAQYADAQEALPRKCRMHGASYDLETATLPICTTKRTTRPRQAESIRRASPTPQAQRQRGPASVATPATTTRLTFESYLNSNATHPAFARARVLPQEAFKDWSKPAVISGSSFDTEPENRAPANTSSSAQPTATTPSSPILSSPPTPDSGNH